nr:hypothetical protein [Angustibacter aerolatus]
MPAQPWYPGGALTTIGAFRFDDPAEEVGVETFLLRAGDAVVQVPLTYRAAPLAGADDALVTTMEHSVLGRRWVYDGCADPVFAATLAHTVLTGGVQAEPARAGRRRRRAARAGRAGHRQRQARHRGARRPRGARHDARPRHRAALRRPRARRGAGAGRPRRPAGRRDAHRHLGRRARVRPARRRPGLTRVYEVSASRASSTWATPSSWHGGATASAAASASGCPSVMA